MTQTTCENCKEIFTVLPQDLALYNKIGVPAPRYCFKCRMQQLMMWRNERTLYNRKDAHKKDIISIFKPQADYVVYSPEDWWNDNWDPLSYGQDYDFSRPFFVQYQELLKKVPLISLFNQSATNSPYCNHSEDSKDCHLIFASIWNEGVSYSRGAVHCKDSQDVFQGEKLELCYDTIDCEGSYNLKHSQECSNCSDSSFLFNCRNCSNCVGCVNLRNKSYCIFNEQYSEEEYKKKIAELHLETSSGIQEMRKMFDAFVLKFPHQFAHLTNTENVVGNHVSAAKDCYYCFSIFQGTENCRYVSHGGANFKDSIDTYGAGAGEQMFKCLDTGINCSKILCAVVGRGGFNNTYIFYCHNSDNIFGCIGLRNKKYCILNKQYTKEEYEALVPKIIQHMNDMPYVDSKGRKFMYGDFFPSEISPFTYNETIAQEYYPLSKEEATKQGFAWNEPEKKSHTVTIKESDLPDMISEVQDEILQQVIGCEHEGNCKDQCTAAFKLTIQELKFYRDRNLPIPRLCPNCRHYSRRAKQEPMQLWHRTCMCNNKAYKNTSPHHHGESPCTNEFETSYNPTRPEIVYCKDCFNAEVA